MFTFIQPLPNSFDLPRKQHHYFRLFTLACVQVSTCARTHTHAPFIFGLRKISVDSTRQTSKNRSRVYSSKALLCNISIIVLLQFWIPDWGLKEFVPLLIFTSLPLAPRHLEVFEIHLYKMGHPFENISNLPSFRWADTLCVIARDSTRDSTRRLQSAGVMTLVSTIGMWSWKTTLKYCKNTGLWCTNL